LGRIRRGGYLFLTWKSDHPPRHVHVYRNDRLVVKWDLDGRRPMEGFAPRRLREIIGALEMEGKL
jgi:hypothetical protein